MHALLTRCNSDRTIGDHLLTLLVLGRECNHITEFGTGQGSSTLALAAACPHKIITYDVDEARVKCVEAWIDGIISGVTIDYRCQSSIEVVIEETDLIFFDTLHAFGQVYQELSLHGNKARKYLVFHDTVTYGQRARSHDMKRLPSTLRQLRSARGSTGIMDAIREYIVRNTHWHIEQHHQHQHGLLICSRTA